MINLGEPDLPRLAVERLLRRYKDEKRRRKWEPVYRELLAEAERLASPAAIGHEFSLDRVSELSEWLPSDTTSVVLAVCTLGQPIETHITELAEKDLVSAVILNEITLALINALTRTLHASIRNRVQPRGLKAGAAYRPGVGRWPLEAQQSVFTRLPAHKIGVTLNNQLWMMPTKSTSLIIPLLDRHQASKDKSLNL